MPLNNSKRILSQLFDIKPMKNPADLDWEAIGIIDKILDLKNAMTGQEVRARRESLILSRAPRSATSRLRGMPNIRDLRENESAVFIKNNENDHQKKPVKVRRFFEESDFEESDSDSDSDKAYSQLLAEDYFAAINKKKYPAGGIIGGNFDDNVFIRDNAVEQPEINKELPLTQKDALRELENIDARDSHIEERCGIDDNFDDSAVYTGNVIDFAGSKRGWARDYFENSKRFFEFLYSPPLLFPGVRFSGFAVFVFAVLSFFSAAFFWNKTNDSGELISASSYQSIVAGAGESADKSENNGIFASGSGISGDDVSLGGFFSFLEKYGREYLLIFQNSAEMRAAGGAAEFYGILRFENGAPADFGIGEILELDAKLTENIVPPRPLQKISTGWAMHDANWFPDFPSSARQTASFYEKTNGEAVDGVIFFNSAFFADLLRITGSVRIDGYEKEISADNVSDFLAQKTDNLKFLLKEEENFFPRFARFLLEKISLLDETGQKKIFAVLPDNLDKRNIQAFFKNAEAENIILANGWGGEMRADLPAGEAGSADFLSVISSSVDGYKNDGNIREAISHESEIQADGSIIGAVRVSKNYRSAGLDNKSRSLVDYDYLRVYVPFGSELLEAEGLSREDYYEPIDYEKNNFQRDALVDEIEKSARFHESGAEVFAENGKTVFGGWIYAAPGHSVSVKYKYKLPFKISKSGGYSLTVRRQSGSIDSEFAGTIGLADNFIIKDKSDNLREEGGVYKIIDNLDRDLEYGVLFE